MKLFSNILVGLMVLSMARFPGSHAGPTPKPKPIPPPPPIPVATDISMVSFDSTSDTLIYKTDFGKYLDRVPFTLANNSTGQVNVLGEFTITPVNSAGAYTGMSLKSSAAFKLMASGETGPWDIFNSMPVYYGDGHYELLFCLTPYDLDGVTKLVDINPADNCKSRIFILKSDKSP